MAAATLTTASVLAFERKLDPSDAVFTAGVWDDRRQSASWPNITVREKSVRGTISHRNPTNGKDPAKLDAQIQSPNLQTVDVAALPENADTLCTRFTLRVLGGTGKPSACNNADYAKRLQAVVAEYADTNGFSELANRYAYNLANGRCLWRNRMGAEQVEVQVHRLVAGSRKQTWVFNAFDLDLKTFALPEGSPGQALTELAGVIAEGLAGDNHVLLEIVTYARIGDGQEVFPSQELIMDKGNAKGSKSKTLYTVANVAAMHSQKIGNALRTIDTWYPTDEEGLGPIAVEPYGSVTSQGRAYRQPKQKMDFYSLFDQWLIKEVVPAPEQQHYVMATLIRGGVFGATEKE
jgi:CRISPR-associated protein Csy3